MYCRAAFLPAANGSSTIPPMAPRENLRSSLLGYTWSPTRTQAVRWPAHKPPVPIRTPPAMRQEPGSFDAPEAPSTRQRSTECRFSRCAAGGSHEAGAAVRPSWKSVGMLLFPQEVHGGTMGVICEYSDPCYEQVNVRFLQKTDGDRKRGEAQHTP